MEAQGAPRPDALHCLPSTPPDDTAPRDTIGEGLFRRGTRGPGNTPHVAIPRLGTLTIPPRQASSNADTPGVSTATGHVPNDEPFSQVSMISFSEQSAASAQP